MYGLPKIHKQGVAPRPIITCINSVTDNIAKCIAPILAPLFGNTPHHNHKSNKVKGVKLDPGETMVSYDMTSLFICIPTMEAVKL